MPKTYSDRPKGMKAVRLDLSEQERDDLRKVAGISGLPMSQYTRMLVLDAIDAAKKKNPGIFR